MRYTVKELAEKTGKSTSHLYDLIRNFRLHRDPIDGLIDDELYMNVGTILGLLPHSQQVKYSQQIQAMIDAGKFGPLKKS